MANDVQEARTRAEANFKKKEQQVKEGAKAMAEYEAKVTATREKTARLRPFDWQKKPRRGPKRGGSPRQNSRPR